MQSLRHIILLFSILTACHLSQAQENNLASDMTFHCSWDTSLKPDLAAGAESWTGDYVTSKGIHGHAFKTSGKPVAYLPNGNFMRDKGTLSLWFKLDKEAATGSMSLVRATNFQLQINRSKNQVFFMVGDRLPDRDFKWDYGLLLRNKNIPVEKWTHLVLTWDRTVGSIAVYLNGEIARKHATELLGQGAGSRSLEIGKNAPGLFDELAIWSRVLTENQIRELYQKITPINAINKITNSIVEGWRLEPALHYFNYENSLVSPNEPVQIKVTLTNKTSSPQSMNLQMQLLDVWEKPASKIQLENLTLAPGHKKTFIKEYKLSQTGCYKLRVMDVDTPSRFRDITSFGVLPHGNPPKHSFLGAHVNGTKYMPEMARRLGFSANRVHNMTQFTWWNRLEPEAGKWDVKKRRQRQYNRYLNLGFTHYGQWFAAPYWAHTTADGSQHKPNPKGYPKGWVPNNEQALRQYITRSIQDFPEITQWEMWNEPYVSMFWQGSPDQYFAMCKIMYQQAKSTNPDLQIFAQLPHDGPWFDRVLKLGVLDYCDGIAFHNYYNGSAHPQSPAMYVKKIRSKLKTYGKENIPLMNSESGVVSGPFLRGLDIPEYSPEQLKTQYQFRQAASMMVQSSVVLMSQGLLSRYYYFHQPVNLQKGRAYPGYSTCELTRSPLPTAISHAVFAWQLDGGQFIDEIQIVDGLRAYLFKRQDGNTLAVLWCENKAKIRMSAVFGLVKNMMGNLINTQNGFEIADEPMYLISKLSADQLTAQLQKQTIKVINKPEVITVSEDGSKIEPFIPMPDFQVATEVGIHRLKPIDLSNFVNMSLRDEIQGDSKGGWTDEGPNNDASMLSPGDHKWFGVPFKLPGKTNTDPSVITLRGMTFQSGPKSVGPIPVNLPKVRGLFFAHAANWMRGNDSEVPVTYTINYADGSTVKLPMRGGHEINNWWFKPTENEESHAIQLIHPNPISTKHPQRYMRVYYWENPKNQQPIESISIDCTDEKLTYVLCGITAAQQ